MRGMHSSSFADHQLPVLLDMCSRPASSVVQDQCLLCFKESVHIRNHIARHMQALALFVLPRTDKDEREDTGSVQNQNAASVASDDQEQQTGNELSEDEISAGALSNISESAMKEVSPVASQGSDNSAQSENAAQSGKADFKTVFGMMIHLKDTQSARRQLHLDAGSAVNVISYRVVRALGLEMGQYKGELITLGGEISPIGLVTFEWHILGRTTSYISDFAVLEDKYTKDFDILLGKATIDELRLFSRNYDVW